MSCLTLSWVQPFATPWDCSMPGSSVLYCLQEFEQIHVHCVDDAIQPSHPLWPSFPTSGFFPMSQFFPSGGQNTYWSFSFSISPSNEYSGLIYFRIDWFDLLAVQGTLKRVFFSTTSLKASVPGCSVFFIAQLSHLYMTTGKTIALTIWTFVSKVMSQLFNVLLGLSYLFFQGASVFQFHGYSHHLQWFFSPRK